jgi:hypothetical protein
MGRGRGGTSIRQISTFKTPVTIANTGYRKGLLRKLGVGKPIILIRRNIEPFPKAVRTQCQCPPPPKHGVGLSFPAFAFGFRIPGQKGWPGLEPKTEKASRVPI